MAELARQFQHVTGKTVNVAFADQGCTGDAAAQAARGEGPELQAIKLSEAKNGFVLLPETLTGLHFIVFAMLIHAGSIMKNA